MDKTIKILNVETASKGKRQWLKVTGDDNKTQNIFPGTHGYELITKGKTVKLTIQKNEETDYWDVTDIQEVGNTPANAPQTTPQANMTRDQSINRSVALKAAVELVAAGKVDIEKLLGSADKLLEWLNK